MAYWCVGYNSLLFEGQLEKESSCIYVAYGNPCKVIREINEHDRVFFNKKDEVWL